MISEKDIDPIIEQSDSFSFDSSLTDKDILYYRALAKKIQKQGFFEYGFGNSKIKISVITNKVLKRFIEDSARNDFTEEDKFKFWSGFKLFIDSKQQFEKIDKSIKDERIARVKGKSLEMNNIMLLSKESKFKNNEGESSLQKIIVQGGIEVNSDSRKSDGGRPVYRRRQVESSDDSSTYVEYIDEYETQDSSNQNSNSDVEIDETEEVVTSIKRRPQSKVVKRRRVSNLREEQFEDSYSDNFYYEDSEDGSQEVYEGDSEGEEEIITRSISRRRPQQVQQYNSDHFVEESGNVYMDESYFNRDNIPVAPVSPEKNMVQDSSSPVMPQMVEVPMRSMYGGGSNRGTIKNRMANISRMKTAIPSFITANELDTGWVLPEATINNIPSIEDNKYAIEMVNQDVGNLGESIKTPELTETQKPTSEIKIDYSDFDLDGYEQGTKDKSKEDKGGDKEKKSNEDKEISEVTEENVMKQDHFIQDNFENKKEIVMEDKRSDFEIPEMEIDLDFVPEMQTHSTVDLDSNLFQELKSLSDSKKTEVKVVKWEIRPFFVFLLLVVLIGIIILVSNFGLEEIIVNIKSVLKV